MNANEIVDKLIDKIVELSKESPSMTSEEIANLQMGYRIMFNDVLTLLNHVEQISGGKVLTREELEALGLNASVIDSYLEMKSPDPSPVEVAEEL